MQAGLDHARFLAQRHFGALDGLRCLSIVAVVWHHTRFQIPDLRLDNRGFLGVDMFFVLSGFLIVTLLLRERDRRGDISLRHFYIRRAFRIFPLYYGLILGITLGLWLVRPGAEMAGPWFRELPFLLTYTANWVDITTLFAIAWSLAAEEQFYLVWPPIERALARHALWILAAAILLSQLIHFRVLDGPLAQLGVGPEDLPFVRRTGFTPILLGVGLAHLLHDARGYAWAARLVGPRWMPLALLGALLGLAAFTPEDMAGWPRVAIHLTMFLLLGSCVVREDHLLQGVLKFAPIARIGVISYGMYLMHMLARHGASMAIEKTGISFQGDLFVLSLILTIGAAEFSFRVFETPFLRWKDRFGQLPATQPAAAR